MALSDEDLKNIKNLVEVTFDEKLDVVLDRKLEERLSHLPNKEEFYAKMDEIMGELKAIREEQAVVSHQISNHEDRIGILEQKVGIQTP